MVMIIGVYGVSKGQLISKCPFGVTMAQSTNEIFSRISALA
jgi:hypothetical protein